MQIQHLSIDSEQSWPPCRQDGRHKGVLLGIPASEDFDVRLSDNFLFFLNRVIMKRFAGFALLVTPLVPVGRLASFMVVLYCLRIGNF